MSRPRFAACLAAVLLAPAAAPAQTTTYAVIPSVYADAEGPGVNNVLVRHQGSPYTAQFVYSATALATLAGTEITGLTFRTATPSSPPPGPTTASASAPPSPRPR